MCFVSFPVNILKKVVSRESRVKRKKSEEAGPHPRPFPLRWGREMSSINGKGASAYTVAP
jgi:hypothetical protein